MTKKELEKDGVLVEESDFYDGEIYLGTRYYFLHKDGLFCSEEHSNLNRYTGENDTFIMCKYLDIDKTSDIWFCSFLSEEGVDKLRELVK